MRVIVWGASGHMGRIACNVLQEKGHELVGRVSQGLRELAPADVIIDFSLPECTSSLLDYALQQGLPVVIATSGHSEQQQAQIEHASKTIPILQAANFSLGLNLMLALVEAAAPVLADTDIEIVEVHHRRKQDAPSGSAKELLAVLQRALGHGEPVYGRQGLAPRQPRDIGIHALRGGNIVGEHRVHFFTDAETLTLTHTVHDRRVYAEGAVKAAEFLYHQPPGYYTMKDLLRNHG